MKIRVLTLMLSLIAAPAFAQPKQPVTSAEFQALVAQVAALTTQVNTQGSTIASLVNQAVSLNQGINYLIQGGVSTGDLAGTWAVMARSFSLHSTPPSIGEDFITLRMILQSNGTGTITYNVAETNLDLTVPATLQRTEGTVSGPFTWGFDGRLVTLTFSDGGTLNLAIAAGGHAILGGNASPNGPDGSFSDIWMGIKLPPQ